MSIVLTFDDVWIAISAHALLYIFALMLTRKPVVTTFHLFLATSTITFVVRPALATIAGEHTLYPVRDSWHLYKLGLVYQFVFNFLSVVIYIFVWRLPRIGAKPSITGSITKGYWLSFLAGLSSVAIIHMLSAGAWLPAVRSATITSVVPFGKLLFPLAVIPLSVVIPFAYLVFVRRRASFLTVIPGVMLTSLLLSLLYQRGFFILGLIITVILINRLARFTYKQAAVVAVVVILALFLFRPIGLILSGAQLSEALGGNMVYRIRNFVLGPNFDILDVWPVTIEYTRINGFTGGSTLTAIPWRFARPGFRYNVGILTAVDRLNEFYWGDLYWLANFGFNVNLAQEGYLNFGLVGLTFGFLPGLVMAWIDRWLWNLRSLSPLNIYLIAAALSTGGFSGEIGGALQWATAYAGIGLAIGTVSRTRWRARRAINVTRGVYHI